MELIFAIQLLHASTLIMVDQLKIIIVIVYQRAQMMMAQVLKIIIVTRIQCAVVVVILVLKIIIVQIYPFVQILLVPLRTHKI